MSSQNLTSQDLVKRYSVSPHPQQFCVIPFLTHTSTYLKTIRVAETHNWQVCHKVWVALFLGQLIWETLSWDLHPQNSNYIFSGNTIMNQFEGFVVNDLTMHKIRLFLTPTLIGLKSTLSQILESIIQILVFIKNSIFALHVLILANHA